MTGDRAIAEEVVQETFLALWNRAELFDPGAREHLPRGCGPSRATGPSTGSVRPAVVQRWSRSGAGRRPTRFRGVDRPGMKRCASGVRRWSLGPAEAALAEDLRVLVGEALAAMPDDERTVIVLAYRDDMTQKEIAERLGWPLGTVKTRTRRALVRLRGLLEPGRRTVGLRNGRTRIHDGSR